MADSFDPIEYLAYLRRQGRFAALAIGSAVVLTAVISYSLPNRYTAVATLVIEPPVANDPRAATAVTPVYLESLKTYEQFAGSDTLFAKACVKFQLSDTPETACTESFKRRVLRVNKLKDTKVLQLSATLPDAKQAQQLVQFLATETVALNRTLARDSDREALGDVQTQLTGVQAELSQARSAYEAATASGAESLLEEEIRTLNDLKSRASIELLRSRTDMAELTGRGNTAESSLERARLTSLTTEAESLDRKLASRSSALAAARARRERAEESLRTAESKFEIWSKRANESASAGGLRTEQLRIVDPGVVPQQPSFPNPPLFIGAALLVSSLLSLAFLSLSYGMERQRARRVRAEPGQPQPAEIPPDYKAARGGHR
ncbi:MAG: hypothetical protein ABI995_10695 [Acidobacteriota bacterium]